MKLLSTIAFLLLTFSVYSQEKLSYQDGLILKGEEVISLNDFKLLLNGVEMSTFNVSRAQKQRRAAQSEENTVLKNIALLATAGLIEFSSLIFIGNSDNTGTFLVALAGAVTGGNVASKMTTSMGFEIRAEQSLIKAVMKYNKKIDSY
tara:strand:+ start:97 stop:540 length:444 start_codon:yes stop_codon:yes gene_type:complete